MADSVFADFDFKWRGVPYKIPANRIMSAIARVEQHITLPQLYEAMNDPRTLKLESLSAAFTGILNMAGANETLESVYAGIFPAGDTKLEAMTACAALINMMVPKSVIDQAVKDAEKDAAKQAQAMLDAEALGRKKNRAARRAEASSSPRTKRRSIGA